MRGTLACCPAAQPRPLPASKHTGPDARSPRSTNAPDVSASSGQGRNQSIVHPLIRPGNCCARVLNLLPTGLKHSMTCRLSLTRFRKKEYKLSQVSATPGWAAFMIGRMSLIIMSSSSLGINPVNAK